MRVTFAAILVALLAGCSAQAWQRAGATLRGMSDGYRAATPPAEAVSADPDPTDGLCHWTFQCDPMGGGCRQVPVCASGTDLVPPRPPAVAPIAPPSIRPIPQPMVPPVGASTCAPAYLCNSFGQCRWQTVCQ